MTSLFEAMIESLLSNGADFWCLSDDTEKVLLLKKTDFRCWSTYDFLSCFREHWSSPTASSSKN